MIIDEKVIVDERLVEAAGTRDPGLREDGAAALQARTDTSRIPTLTRDTGRRLTRPPTGRGCSLSRGLSEAHPAAEQIQQSRLMINRRIKLVINKPIRIKPVPEPPLPPPPLPPPPLPPLLNGEILRRRRLNPHWCVSSRQASCFRPSPEPRAPRLTATLPEERVCPPAASDASGRCCSAGVGVKMEQVSPSRGRSCTAAHRRQGAPPRGPGSDRQE
ncbi:unnamed protein product [Pleuronectes platessa]|uniref:Uncharacterized protein n=1 Tax=Pleuronectes platessa TaxID=8262 RepID=A0A9N7TIR4_PLEPL|nr:unnamed protein product [Pleuronectes platessa]